MDEEQYWRAYQRAAEIEAQADIARALAIGIGKLHSDTRSEFIFADSAINQLANSPGRSGSSWTRREITGELDRLGDVRRRLQIRLDAIKPHKERADADLQLLMSQRESVVGLIGKLTLDRDVLKGYAKPTQEKGL